MSQDDPFGLYRDVDRTVVIRPQPGGRPVASIPLSAPAPIPAGTVAHPSANPLIAAGARLLSLAGRLRRPEPPSAGPMLRETVLGELREFSSRAAAAGATRDEVSSATWALCALLDDVVLNTPWGRQSGWASQTLCGTIYQEVDAGERFFDRLQQLEREPASNARLLEFWHACLAMGFEGRYRVPVAGGGSVAQVRDELYRILRSITPPPPSELAGSWRGVAVPLEPPPRLPLWVLAVGTTLLILAIWAPLAFRAGDYTADVFAQVRDLPPATQPDIMRPVASQPAAVPEPNLPMALLPAFQSLLADEIRAGRVGAEENATALVLRLRNQGLFASGRADPDPAYDPLFQKLGRALDAEDGRIVVIGHTDDQPIRKSPRFRSNWELSQARAAAVADKLRPGLRDPQRMRIEGRADSEPLVPNRDEASRAQNRRVEILLLKSG